MKILTPSLPWHENRRWARRRLTDIRKIIIHQGLGEGDVEAVNRYHIRPNHISPKGCPHFCYHYGIEKNGQIIQANHLADITWHTAGENATGIGIMVAGNFTGAGYTLGTTDPSQDQMDALEWLVNYLCNAFGFSNQEVYGHYHFGKRACPGTLIEQWIEAKRGVQEPGVADIPQTISELQSRLTHLGFYQGPANGIFDTETASALRLFQATCGLTVDGIAGPETWKALVGGGKEEAVRED
jgi:N-acetyl-anhydromuramyl-L-alanine amidase AmpD